MLHIAKEILNWLIAGYLCVIGVVLVFIFFTELELSPWFCTLMYHLLTLIGLNILARSLPRRES